MRFPGNRGLENARIWGVVKLGSEVVFWGFWKRGIGDPAPVFWKFFQKFSGRLGKIFSGIFLELEKSLQEFSNLPGTRK